MIFAISRSTAIGPVPDHKRYLRMVDQDRSRARLTYMADRAEPITIQLYQDYQGRPCGERRAISQSRNDRL
jgi:hypothetical protein